MPEPMVRDDLVARRLKRLDLPDWPGGFYALHAIYRTGSSPKPAVAWISQHFARQMK
jgi:DNA-binding transcriptional LysR family regulator